MREINRQAALCAKKINCDEPGKSGECTPQNFVLTSALTCVLSPRRSRRSAAQTDGERRCAITISGLRQTVRPIPPLDFSKRRNVILPLLSLTHPAKRGGERARSPDASRNLVTFGSRDSVWTAGVISAAFLWTESGRVRAEEVRLNTRPHLDPLRAKRGEGRGEDGR